MLASIQFTIVFLAQRLLAKWLGTEAVSSEDVGLYPTHSVPDVHME